MYIPDPYPLAAGNRNCTGLRCVITSTLGVLTMSKGRDTKKETKKEPAKSIKEKKAAKKAKKEEKRRGQ